MKYPRIFHTIAISIFAIGLSNIAYSQPKVPQWLLQAAAQQTPPYEIRNIPAVLLYKEESVNVASDGTVVRTTREAVRILEREGRDEAIARVVYQTDSDRVRSLEGWLIKRGGAPKAYGRKEIVDVALADNDLYNEARCSYISARLDADVGDVFGFESVLEEKTIFSQFHYGFQNDIPVLYSRFLLNMPAGWRAESVTFNAPKVEPAVNGSSYSWEMRDLKPIRPEPRSPRWSSLAPRLAVSMFPDQNASTRLKTFSNWNDVARWMASIEDPQMTTSPALVAKAKELTADAKTEFEKIRAISRFAQGIQYISIQIGTGRGGGYVPRPAAEVFSRSYGDCKDKANLMRAMLSVIGIESYLVSITADDPGYVRAEWASPHQFNHCIIAVKIGPDTRVDSVVTHPTLGRLLIFDPTDAFTPIGDLPEDQQGSLALIDHKDTQDLLKMPVMPADSNMLDRKIDVMLMPDGSINGTVRESTLGQAARQERARLRGLSIADYNRVIDRWISRGATGAKTTNIVPTDKHDEGKFDLRVEFTANSYAQLMQQRLMVFKPAIVGRLDRLSFADGPRLNPYRIDASSFRETVRIRLPDGFEIDEMPDPSSYETEFGKFDMTFKVEGRELVLVRSLDLNRAIVAPEKYDSVKNFFGRLHAAEQSPVVLIRN
ncbi:MAG TPA: DUF3857 domain-containing protein [Pyrinomonadaceae bacterium]|nr:DUF3857 domain-containing protein [Pyrinomonadaceae bacterium]